MALIYEDFKQLLNAELPRGAISDKARKYGYSMHYVSRIKLGKAYNQEVLIELIKRAKENQRLTEEIYQM